MNIITNFIMDKLDEGYTVKKKSKNTYVFTINNKVILKDFFETLYYNNKNEFRFGNVETKPR
jgi:hypothetical protein